MASAASLEGGCACLPSGGCDGAVELTSGSISGAQHHAKKLPPPRNRSAGANNMARKNDFCASPAFPSSQLSYPIPRKGGVRPSHLPVKQHTRTQLSLIPSHEPRTLLVALVLSAFRSVIERQTGHPEPGIAVTGDRCSCFESQKAKSCINNSNATRGESGVYCVGQNMKCLCNSVKRDTRRGCRRQFLMGHGSGRNNASLGCGNWQYSGAPEHIAQAGVFV